MKSRSVLIVEDDDWFADQHMRTLSAAGFTVKRVSHGPQAIRELDRSIPDAVVLDMFLPGPNALVLLHEIQSYSDLASVPVIVCSNSAADLPIAQLALYGVRAVIDKTLMHPGDVVAAVKKEMA